MSNEKLPRSLRRGALAWFASNHVAANLVMIFVITAGLLSLARIKLEFFPELDINWVTVSVPYPGATPEEVETGIIQTVEESVREVDYVRQVKSIAAESIGTVMIEFERYADMDEARDDVNQVVDRITTFPEEAEEPVVAQATNRTQVLLVAIHGETSDRALKELAERVRDDLTTGRAEQIIGDVAPWWEKALGTIRAPKGISTVTISGLPPYEISIEVSEDTLRRHDLTFDDVAAAVRRSSLDLSAGTVRAEGGHMLVRTKGQYYTAEDFEQVVVMTNPDGTNLTLNEVATVIDGFAETDEAYKFDGKPAIAVSVYRVGEQDTLEVARAVRRYVAALNEQLPEGIGMTVMLDNSELLKGRINLLLRNGAIGLLLVFLVLACFLDLRLAFWTMLGIPMSFLGAFILLPMFDMSLNMISLFAFIVVLGIVVDDAIVVGENIFNYRQSGKMSGLAAAIRGVREMFGPVTMAIATTIVAFMPLMQGEGTWFQILRAVPVVVISVLLISLIEAFVVLPSHLSGGRLVEHHGPIGRFQAKLRHVLNWMIEHWYRPTLIKAIRHRYVTLAIGFALLMITGGVMAGGHLRTEFFPSVEADNMLVALTMPPGTPVEQTMQIVKRFEDAADDVRIEFEAGRPEGAEPLFKHTTTIVGSQPMTGEMSSRGGGTPEDRSGGHLAEVNVELLQGERRGGISAEKMVNRWREIVGEVPGATSLEFTAKFMSSDPISVELAHRDQDQLLAAVEDMTETLAAYDGVTDITDNYVVGKRQIEIIGLTPLGEALGVRKVDVARQLRQAFYGEEAQRIQRERDEIKVMVRYTEAERRSAATLEDMRIRLADGAEVPLLDVVQVRYGRDFAVIYRTDQARTVQVLADIDKAVANAEAINKELKETVLPELIARYPGLAWDMEGEQKERNDAMGSLKTNFIFALFAIYFLLAIQFRSYVQPVIIMLAIPFGLVGAVFGHMIMGVAKSGVSGNLWTLINEQGLWGGFYEAMSGGLPLSFMSMFGIVALTGVVVNDSLIMINLINAKRAAGDPLDETLEQSGTRRFRPILLTTLTTFFGLLPMILERSIQAQFLIPMAVSLGFGVLFATAITLIIVPSCYMILEDLRRLFLGTRGAEEWFDPGDHSPKPEYTEAEEGERGQPSSEFVPIPESGGPEEQVPQPKPEAAET